MAAQSDATPVPVVCALIERDGLVLLAQRPGHKHLGGKWEFPGGKVEPGEAPAAALVREIKEELGCAIEPVRSLPPCVHHYASASIELIPFVCRLTSDTIEPVGHEHTALAWVAPRDLLQPDLTPADIPVIHAYLQSLSEP
jgi:8-oxo-dGTP diphosphatase